jgi:hypothetical protein
MNKSTDDRGRHAPSSKAGSRLSKILPVGLVLGAFALVIGIHVLRSMSRASTTSTPQGSWAGSVTQLWRAGGGNQGLEVCQADGKNCGAAVAKTNIDAPSQIKTDDRTRASVGFGEDVDLLLDRNTEVLVPDAHHRQLKMIRGSAVLNSKGNSTSKVQVQVPGGTLDVGPSKVAITADSKGTVIDVAHGVLRVIDDKQKEARVHAGEQIRIVEGRIRTTTSNASLGEDLAWSKVQSQADQTDETSRGLGQLKAKKPGTDDELKGAVALTSHNVQVRIVSNLVRTQVEEVFVNRTDDVLEGIYRFPLPSDAKIERLALDVDGKLEEGAFVDRDRAAAIWRGAIVNATPVNQRVIKDDIVWVPGPWRDPALLEWQRGGRFELRIYPIPKRGSRRVLMTYTQISNPSGDARRYMYPLAYDPSATTKIGQFDLDVQVRGHDVDKGVRSIGYTLRQATDSGVTRLSTSERDFTPHGDIILEYTLPHGEAELTAWAYDAHGDKPAGVAGVTSTIQERGSGYASLALRPAWPRNESDVARDVVLVVDASRSMLGENLKRAERLALRLLAELEPSDRASVLVCDSACEVLPDGLAAAGPELVESASRFLSSIRAEGASDPTAAVRAALVLTDRGRTDRPSSIVYIGDGTPTAGPIRPGTVEKAIEHDIGDAPATVIAVGVGGDSDSETLSAMARGGGGVTVNFLPGKSLDEVAYNVLGAVRGTHLRDVRVSLPEGLVDVAPRRPDSLRSGGELWVHARMQRPAIRGDVILRGRLGKAPFERRWPIDLVATRSDGNAFVPRLFAAARIADLERQGDAESKREVIELSQSHHVASRYTSLLVLESEAMIKAFHLVKTEQTQEWSGESEDEQQGALEEAKSEQNATGTGDSRPQRVAGSVKSSPFDDEGMPAAAPKPLKRAMQASVGESGAAAKSPAPAMAADEAPPAPVYAQPPPRDQVIIDDPLPTRRRVMIPMRRIWVRTGSFSGERVPQDANVRALAKAEDAYDREPERRGTLRTLLTLYKRRSELDHAESLVERWNDKEPLDADALTARADSEASRGHRSEAIRMLGSVVDVRPDDVKAQQRLARLYRWSGERDQSCRFWIALAEFHSDKPQWLVEAVRCNRNSNNDWLADYLMSNATEIVRQQTERLLAQPPEPSEALSGDLRIEADWSTDADVDIALTTPEGQRVSWLGAPTRQVITAKDVTSRSGEGLALRNAPAGQYVIELVRVSGPATVRGNLSLTIVNQRRTVPFVLRDERTVVGIATITSVAKLIPI